GNPLSRRGRTGVWAAPAAWRGLWGGRGWASESGNTCYVNAQHAILCPTHSSCTLHAMGAHMTQAILHPGEVIQPHKDLLTGFHRHQQEDAHEFLMFSLNAMQQGCLSASQPSGHPSEDTTLIRQIFDTCDPYLDISVDITVAQSVEQALRELDCGVCLRKVPATKRLTLHSTSQVLVLVLKRFTQVSGAKRAHEVCYPQNLDMQPYRSEQKAGPLGYVLYAVLVHSGWSCEQGHYFAYMDNAKVSSCDESAALSQSAYVLFYSREGAWQGGAGGGAAVPLSRSRDLPVQTRRREKLQAAWTGA
ncbi:hypothetical protein FD755_025554, partial [Muntiacus reevesi]